MSEAGPATIQRANAVHPITALQTEYSLWTRDPEDEVLVTCRQLGIGFVAYSPLGRGFLTGRFRSPDDLPADDWRRNNPRFQGEHFQKNLQLVTRLEQMAAARGRTAAQLALAWLLARGEDVVPIVGVRAVSRLEENLAALDAPLSREDVEALDAVAPQGVASGTRYPAGGMATLNR